MYNAPFASTDDVADRWRTLSEDETQLAGTLIEDASDMLRARWPDVDQRIEAGALSEDSVTRVVAHMVKRAMRSPAPEGYSTFNQTAGPFNAGGQLTNPNANLFFNAEDVRLLDGYTPKAVTGWLV